MVEYKVLGVTRTHHLHFSLHVDTLWLNKPDIFLAVIVSWWFSHSMKYSFFYLSTSIYNKYFIVTLKLKLTMTCLRKNFLFFNACIYCVFLGKCWIQLDEYLYSIFFQHLDIISSLCSLAKCHPLVSIVRDPQAFWPSFFCRKGFWKICW